MPVGWVKGLRWRVGLVCALAACGCVHAPSAPTYRLYDASLVLAPAGSAAHLFGPIASVDDRDVRNLGDGFELLPGCHVVGTLGDAVSRYQLIYGHRWAASFALHVKAGHTYIVRPAPVSMLTWRPTINGMYAEEIDDHGFAVRFVAPEHSGGEAASCPKAELPPSLD
jgi:hypothetical protein